MKIGWQKRKLRDVCELINGRAYSKSELLSEGKYPVLRVGNFFTNNHWYYSDLELEDKKYCDTDDLLYAWSASFGPRIWQGGKVIFHYHIWKVVPDPLLIDQGFLFHFFVWDTGQIKEDSGAGTTMIHVSKGSMEDRSIFLPPPSEQQRIVGLLDEAFAGIATAKANAEKNLQNVSAIFDSHLESAFTQRGDGWTERRLSEVAESISTGPFGTMLHKSDYVPNGIPLVNPMNIVGSRIVPSGKMMVNDETRNRLNTYVLKAGDVVVGRRGELGRCALVTNREAGWLCGTGSFFVRLSKTMDGEFFVALLGSNKFKARLEASSVGTTMSSLNHGILNDLLLPVPSRADQRVIMSKIRKVQAEVEHLESIYQRKLAALDDLKKSLLHQAFSGQL